MAQARVIIYSGQTHKYKMWINMIARRCNIERFACLKEGKEEEEDEMYIKSRHL